MKIQIVDDDGKVLYVPAANQNLEHDLRELFGQTKWWRPLKRGHHSHALKEIEKATAALRDKTRFSV